MQAIVVNIQTKDGCHTQLYAFTPIHSIHLVMVCLKKHNHYLSRESTYFSPLVYINIIPSVNYRLRGMAQYRLFHAVKNQRGFCITSIFMLFASQTCSYGAESGNPGLVLNISKSLELNTVFLLSFYIKYSLTVLLFSFPFIGPHYCY